MANTQARGVYTKTRLIPEKSFRQKGSTVLELPINTNDVHSTQGVNSPATITGRRDAAEPIKGNIDVSGDVTVPLDSVAMGYWLAFAFGDAKTTGDGKSGAPKEHVFTPKDTQPSATMEKDFGNGVIATVDGLKVSKMSLQVGGDGELTSTFSLIGCGEVVKSGAGSKATKTAVLDRFNNFHAALEIDDEQVAIATSLSIEIDFGLDDSGYAIGGGGFRSRINEGIVSPGGKVTLFFDNESYIEKAMKSKETNLKVTFTKGKASLIIELPEVQFNRNTPGISGAQGIVQELDFKGYRRAAESCVKITLKNSEAGYVFK